MSRRTPEEMKPLIKKAKALWWENQNLHQTARLMEHEMTAEAIFYWYKKEKWRAEYEKKKEDLERAPSFTQKVDGFRSIILDSTYEFAQNIQKAREIRQTCVTEGRRPTKEEKAKLEALDEAISAYNPDVMKKASSTVKDISMNYAGMKGSVPDPESKRRQGPSLVTVGPKEKVKEEPKPVEAPIPIVGTEASA